MAKFTSTKYKPNASQLKSSVHKHPFLLFGLPFVAMVIIGSFALTPATATRYEHFDKKSRRTEKKGAIDSSGVKRRVFDPREEYYVSNYKLSESNSYWAYIFDRD
jgi:cytochrome c oxidase assembly protein subunit 16